MSQPGKVDHQPAFVLHSVPYKETSLIVELFTRDHGRVSVVARGARRPRAALRGLLLPFQPLKVGWFGKTELKTLAHADWQGALPQLGGVPLLAGLYLNELLLRLTAREDPHSELFADYARAIRALGPRDGQGEPLSAQLRRFELRLLVELGYAPDLRCTQDGAPLDAECRYHCQLPAGVSAHADGEYSGAALLALAEGDFSTPAALRAARTLTRQWLDHCLGEPPLATRALMAQLAELGARASPPPGEGEQQR